MRRLLTLSVSVPLIAFLCLACGPIEYIGQVSRRAATSVVAAKEAGAEKLAPYEYQLALLYLEKAREEGAYAQYQVSVEYGQRAEAFAVKAREIAIARTASKRSRD